MTRFPSTCRSALWVPLFGELADPRTAARLAAAATQTARLGPMVTAAPRRRPARLARETAALDRLSEGRLTLGVGSGEDAEQLRGMDETTRGLRADPDAPFDLAVGVPPGVDPGPWVAAGATWALTEFDPDRLELDLVRGVLRDGPVTA